MANKYDVAAYIWPSYTGDEPRTRIFWPEGYGEWQTVKAAGPKFPGHEWPRKPLWGYQNEADPYVMEMQIEAAVDHGVNVFIYDWYWFDNRPFLDQCLDNGFLKAKNNHKMKFYIMWANHVATTVWDKRTAHDNTPIWDCGASPEMFKTICEQMINKYFGHPSYYKIDNKPVFMFHDLYNFVNGIGGVDAAKKAMNDFNEMAIKAGFDGVHMQLCRRPDNGHMFFSGPTLRSDGNLMDAFHKLGFDSISHYQLCASASGKVPYADMIPHMVETWDYCDKQYKSPYLPHVSLGWDPNPRYNGYIDSVVTDVKPELVKKALMEAKKYIDSHPELPAKLVTINSWNEWTETSYLLPDDLYGYGYLEAVKEVFLGE